MFDIAAGSVAGTAHTKPFQPGSTNSQDAHVVIQTDDYVVGIICDGCGSSPHSEVGAKLGARLVAASITRWDSVAVTEDSLRAVRTDLLLSMKKLLNPLTYGIWEEDALRRARREFINDYMLFTVMGFVATKETTTVFGIGDGVYAVNGAVTVVDPLEGNYPPYPAYALTNTDIPAEKLEFQIHCAIATEQVESLMIGSDGVADLIAAADKPLPGKNAPGREQYVGPIEQFWTEDRYFANPDQLRRQLALINDSPVRLNREKQQLERFPGLLHDDTTLITARRPCR